MQLESLLILHVPKGKGQSFVPPIGTAHDVSQPIFQMETCQRWLWISDTKYLEQKHIPGNINPGLTEVYQGREAYLFLLLLACGLKSEVLGETDIFGQIKLAWRQYEGTRSSLAAGLSPWIRRLFEDVKEIRTQYLQNLGGASYGSLVRKLIRETGAGSLGGPVFLVGAGQIAQSVAPYLTDSELLLWTRHADHLTEFSQSLKARFKTPIKALSTHEEVTDAWRTAAHVVLCIPVDPVGDAQRVKQFQQGSVVNRSVIHLGGMRDQCGPWLSLPHFYGLNDLFSLQAAQGNVRSVQIAQAQRACDERARLRALGASLSICHGWEDLACFA